MRLASYNIHIGVGQDNRYDLERIASAVAGADVVCMQEVLRHWPALGHADQAAELAERLNMHFVYGAGMDIDADEVLPDGRIHQRRRTFGNLVLSRWPIRSSRTLLLPKRAIPEAFDLQRSATEAVIEAPGGAFRVYSVHLSHVSPAQRAPQIEALIEWVNAAPAEGRAWDHENEYFKLFGLGRIDMPAPAVMMGDFNFSPRDAAYARFCGEVIGRYGRKPRHDQFWDAWTLAGEDEEAGQSFMEPKHPGYRIDHCFVSHDLAKCVRRAWFDNQTVGSDHDPLFVEFAWG